MTEVKSKPNNLRPQFNNARILSPINRTLKAFKIDSAYGI